MKKTAIALLSVASFYSGYAQAEVDPDNYCQPGFTLVEDERGDYMCLNEDRLREEEEKNSGPLACYPQQLAPIEHLLNQCTVVSYDATDKCSESAIADATKKMRTQGQALQQEMSKSLKKGDPEFKKACESIKNLYASATFRLQKLKASCETAYTSCVEQCAHSANELGSLRASETSQLCDREIVKAQENATLRYRACESFEKVVKNTSVMTAKLTEAKELAAQCDLGNEAGEKPSDAARVLMSGSGVDPSTGGGFAAVGGAAAGDDPNTGGQAAGGGAQGGGAQGGEQKIGGDGNPSPENSGGGQSNNGGSYAEEKTPEKKKSNQPNNSEMGALMGAASSLLSAFMQKSEPQQVEPIQLDPSDCRRPENMSSTICRCQTNWTPDCNGTTAASESFSSNTLPGVGGAQLNKETGTQLSLGPDEPQFEIPRKNDPGVGGGGAMYGGGGGFSPPPANFTPDNNKGRSGSGLSANILNGTYGGNNMMGAGRGGPAALRPVLRPARRDDPEDLPGYNLGKKNEAPDFRAFLPPGAGSGGGLPGRGISGIGGNLLEGMHPASTDIFQAVSNRYRQLEFTLFADK